MKVNMHKIKVTIVTAIHLILFLPSFSQPNVKGEIFHLTGTDRYVSGIKKAQFQFSYAEQEMNNWCWAACIKMVLKYQGIDVEQTDIVEKAFGSAVNQPANCEVISRAANGWVKEGKTLKAFIENNQSPSNLIDILAYKYPLVIGLNMPGQNVGHAYVLTAIYFKYDSNNRPRPDTVILRDPWPANPERYSTTWSDFISRINCIVHFTY